MDLRKDYDAYKKTISKDAPDYYVEYARITPTNDVETFPTIFDYIRHLADAINLSIEKNDVNAYKKSLDDHNYAIQKLFKKMAKEMIKELGFGNVTPELLTQFKKEFGERWAKHLTLGAV